MEPAPAPTTSACELCGKEATTRCNACRRHVCADCAKTTEPITPKSDTYCLTCWFAVFTTRG